MRAATRRRRSTFPDALTMWRATARGITADTKVGSAIERTIVRKNLILRLAVPRFFREGDEVTVSAIVHNYLPIGEERQGFAGCARAEMSRGRARGDRRAQQGRRPAWIGKRARAHAPEAVLFGKALTDEESDAMELTLPVHPVRRQAERAEGRIVGRRAERSAGGPGVSRRMRRGRRASWYLSVTPSMAGTHLRRARISDQFPYGCTEQTMSSFLPNVVVAQAVKHLDFKTNIEPADLEKKISAGLDRLLRFPA